MDGENETKFTEKQGFFRGLLRLIKITVTLTVTVLLMGVVSIMVAYFYFARDLPNIKTLKDYRPPVVSEVFSADGTKIGEFWKERRLLADLEEVPPILTRAFIAAEDARFFEHRGVDIVGIGRAIWEDVKARSFVQGASTITQQITRSILLSRERKLGRKIREAILATRLERNLNKKQILVLYLNQIFLGNRAYGVKAAAENYFHKSLGELTVGEAALIAGLSRAPSEDNPVKSPKRAKDRQQHVLDRMLKQNFISRQEYQKALSQPLTIYIAQTDKEFNLRYTPYFTEHVRRILLEQYGEKVVYEGGLRIASTVDIQKYKDAEEALRWGLEQLDHRQGYRGPLESGIVGPAANALAEEVHEQALTESADMVTHVPETAEDQELLLGATPLQPGHNYRAIVTSGGRDVEVRVGHNRGTVPAKRNWTRRSFRTGDVIEVRTTENDGIYELVQTPKVQGALFSLEVKTGLVRAMIGGYDYRFSEFNRATQALRQPGSSFKPFVYSAALDKGFTYGTAVADTPVAYRVGIRKIWAPRNYGGKFSGVGNFASHITASRNVPTVKIGHVIGLHYLTGFVRKFGMTGPIGKYLSMSLGANGVYVNEMVSAYTAFGNHGKKAPQTFITKIADVNGTIIKEFKPRGAEEDEAEAIALVEDVDTPDDLNPELWLTNRDWIDKDGLNLDPQEIRVLYGGRIPPGHVITPQTAHLTIGLMQRVVKYGTGRRVAALGRPVAGKTGTTNNETDTWFVGLTPDLAAGVWVGYDEIRRLGRGEQGGRTAAPIFLRYMQKAVADTPKTEFEAPEGFPVARMGNLPGGSAIYWQGGTKDLEDEVEAFATQRMDDRAGDFFEADIGDF